MGGLSFLLIFPRIRRLSIIRQYSSPGDFINDRYNSKILILLITICLCIPQVLVLAVELYTLGIIIPSYTDDELTFYPVVIVSALLIIIFEICGGMRSVAYTDAVQSMVMIFIFISIPIVIGIQYGGFIGQVHSTCNLQYYILSYLIMSKGNECRRITV